MRLYLIRHGKAERGSHSGRDDDRELAPRGHRQAEWLGAVLRKDDSPPDRIIASPAARAARTAGLIAETLGLGVESNDAIGLRTTPSGVLALIQGSSDGKALALVGHNPTLSDLASVLVHGVAARGQIGLRTGQAAVLDLDQPSDPIGTATLLDLLRLED